jgi:hypothetical protein
MSQEESSNYIRSYLTLRKVVGYIGILLPFVLGIGNVIAGHTVPYSVSGYYYSPMRNILVAALCVLGMFLIGYKGYDRLDSRVTNVAGGAAIGVALFPTSSPSFTPVWVGHVHPFFAAVAMVSLALMALQFTQTSPPQGQEVTASWLEDIKRWGRALIFRYQGPDDKWGSKKKLRNRIYSVCAWLILAGVILAFVQNFWTQSAKDVTQWLFWFESLSVVAFGFSWLVKGETILTDNGPPPEELEDQAPGREPQLA